MTTSQQPQQQQVPGSMPVVQQRKSLPVNNNQPIQHSQTTNPVQVRQQNVKLQHQQSMGSVSLTGRESQQQQAAGPHLDHSLTKSASSQKKQKSEAAILAAMAHYASLSQSNKNANNVQHIHSTLVAAAAASIKPASQPVPNQSMVSWAFKVDLSQFEQILKDFCCVQIVKS